MSIQQSDTSRAEPSNEQPATGVEIELKSIDSRASIKQSQEHNQRTNTNKPKRIIR